MLVLVACGGEEVADAVPARASEQPVSEVASESTRIVFLGDSLSAGYGLPVDDAFPARIERALAEEGRPVEVLNAGVSGDTSAGGLSRIDWVLRSQPDIVVVELGANDALRGQPLRGIEDNLRAIVRRAHDAGADVLLLGMDVPTSYGSEYSGGFADLYARIADDMDVAFVPGFIREVALDGGLMQPDGLHPTADGHRVLAERLLPHVRDLLSN
jgi:acyl-CoA thioesterase-1